MEVQHKRVMDDMHFIGTEIHSQGPHVGSAQPTKCLLGRTHAWLHTVTTYEDHQDLNTCPHSAIGHFSGLSMCASIARLCSM